MWRKMGFVVVSVMMGASGCVIEPYESNARFENGCDAMALGVATPPPLITLDRRPPALSSCTKMQAGFVDFDMAVDGGACLLRSGSTDGAEPTESDMESPLYSESGIELSDEPEKEAIRFSLNGPRVYRFYCDEDPAVAGAIFVVE